MKIGKLKVFIGCVSVCFCADLCRAQYPLGTALQLQERLIFCKGSRVIPTAYERLVNQQRECAEKSKCGISLSKDIRLTPFGMGGTKDRKFKPQFVLQGKRESFRVPEPLCECSLFMPYAPYDPEGESGRDVADIYWIDGCRYEVKPGAPCEGAAYLRGEISRCEEILGSEEFWTEVLGVECFNALVGECNAKDGEPFVCLDFKGHSCLLEERKQRSEDSKDFGFEAVDKLFYDVRLSQGHEEVFNEDTESWVRIREGLSRKKTRRVTDFEISFRLVVDMIMEEIEEVRMLDRFIVNEVINRFEENGFLVFKKP